MAEGEEEAATGPRVREVALRGRALKNAPLLNKGTAFSLEERRVFGLEGLLPPAVSTLEEQVARVYGNYRRAEGDVQRYLFLSSLQDRNETLFYRLLRDHIEEMAPVVYTPTVGKVCQTYSHIYRRPRGLFITPEHRGRIADILRHGPVGECRVIVVTDNEAILGLGDQGVGGMGIPIGKLALYTAGAGIHPATSLPIDLDPGTENEELLADPLYLGVRRRRLRGEEYLAFLDEFVEAVAEVFPGAVVQWEDFASENAFQILERYRDRLPSFNDDIQGTAAVVLAGILAALERAGRSLVEERAVFHGIGAAGGGCAGMLRRALELRGLTPEEAARRVLCLDSRGLVLADRPGLAGHKRELACPPEDIAGWELADPDRPPGLLDVVRNHHPTILVGMSGRPGVFDEEVVEAMHARCERPVILPLSNPTSQAEATPADLLRWTRGRAIVATGSPFPPVDHAGQTYAIGQANNVFVFPGVGLGAIAVRARRLPERAFLAAAEAVRGAAPPAGDPGAPLFPPLGELRRVSRRVASAVAHALVECEAAPFLESDEVERRLDALVWEPDYEEYVPAG